MADAMDTELMKKAAESSPWMLAIFLVIWLLRGEIGKILTLGRGDREAESALAATTRAISESAKASAENARLLVALIDEQKRTTIAIVDQTNTLRMLVTEMVRDTHRGRGT